MMISQQAARRAVSVVAATMAAGLRLSGCAAPDEDGTSGAQTKAPAIDELSTDKALSAQLPAQIRDAGSVHVASANFTTTI